MDFWHDIERPIIGLSPMDGVTDASFRRVAARHGRPDLCMTEFTSVEAICCGADGFVRDFAYGECERPVLAQIYGRTPDAFYRVAHIVCELGFDGLDINMGCPARNVANKGCGAGLILNPELAVTLVRAARRGIEDWAAGQRLDDIGLAPEVLARVRSMSHEPPHRGGDKVASGCGAPARTSLRTSSDSEFCAGDGVPASGRSASHAPPRGGERRAIPLSVKTRIGYDRVQVDEWIPVLLGERPTALSVHGRTLKQMYKGSADWDAIGRVVELARGTGTLVLGNGDLKSMADVVERVRRTGVDGVLLGRGAMGNPWVFRDKQQAKDALARGGEFGAAASEVSREERTRVLLEHSRHFEGLWGERRFPAMRKHLAWYCKGFRGAAQWRARMVQARNAAEVARIVSAGERAAG